MSRVALLFAAFIVVSQAAPQLQQQDGASQQTGAVSSTGSSVSGSTPSSSSSSGAPGSGTATSQPVAVVLPTFSNFLPTFNLSGNSGSGSSGQNPITAIISLIPNAINAEREHFGNAVQQIVSEQVNAATDSVNSAAETGGKFVSNGIKIIGSWPAFFGNLLG